VASESLLVLTTCSSTAEADSLATALVQRRLAACVNSLGGVTSTYRWQGDVAREQENLLLIKTTAERYAALEEAIRELSSYELPEILAVRVAAGSEGYLAWLAASVDDVGTE
jgi:periplasmic divalent cation tolerance protein